jgi:undecaprenyl-diphosphatase
MRESDGSSLGLELAAILGLVEGLTEFLPVSSTGHLIIVGHFMGFTGAVADTAEVAIQLGSILAIMVYERHKIASLFSQAAEELIALLNLLKSTPRHGVWEGTSSAGILRRSIDQHRSLWFLIGLVIAFLPAALVGFVAHDWIEHHLFTPQTVAVALIVGGAIILWVEAAHKRVHVTMLEQVSVRTALTVGLAQCCALFPGVSLSVATIIGGLLAGMDRRVATEYSFFLALPTMIVATAYKMLKSFSIFTHQDLVALMVGLIVSFFVAWAVIAAFLAFVKQHTLSSFAYYRIALGIIVLMMFY